MTLADEYARVLAMSDAWDEAALCLSKHNSEGFDEAMKRFNSLRKEHEEGRS